MALSANAVKYYVSPTGSDASTALQAQNLATPWKTIQKAANTMVAGDTVYIRAGAYKEQVTPKNSGNASGYITYAAHPGETVTIDGTGMGSDLWSGMFNIISKTYITIRGVRIINAPSFGVHIYSSNHIQILNNFTNNTSNSGVHAQSSAYITVDGNEVAFPSQGGDQNNGIQEGISFDNVPNSTVSNNSLHDGGMEGIDFKVGSSNGKIFGNTVYNMYRIGIYVDGYSQSMDNVEVYNNIVRDSKPVITGSGDGAIVIGAERGVTMSNIKIYNNLVYNISGSGIGLSEYHESGTPLPTYTNISIYNNTTYNTGTKVNNPWGGGGIYVAPAANASTSGIVIRNNIMSKAPLFNISAPPTATVSNNLFDGGGASGTSPVTGNPLFVNAAGANFHLQLTSPAINAGISTGVPLNDFDGVPRTGNPDVGAYEYKAPPSILPIANISKTLGLKVFRQKLMTFIDRTGVLKFKAYDVSGSQIMNFNLEVNSGDYTIPFNFKAGIYLIKLEHEDRVVLKKFLIM
jgi:parallel beta-helix repeat protein